MPFPTICPMPRSRFFTNHFMEMCLARPMITFCFSQSDRPPGNYLFIFSAFISMYLFLFLYSIFSSNQKTVTTLTILLWEEKRVDILLMRAEAWEYQFSSYHWSQAKLNFVIYVLFRVKVTTLITLLMPKLSFSGGLLFIFFLNGVLTGLPFGQQFAQISIKFG